jgi:hypothetical protein
MPYVQQATDPQFSAHRRKWVQAKFRLNMTLLNLLKGEHIDHFDFIEPTNDFFQIRLWVRPLTPPAKHIISHELDNLIKEGFVTSTATVERGDKLELNLDLKPLEAQAEAS